MDINDKIIASLQTNTSPGPDGLTLGQNKINFENRSA